MRTLTALLKNNRKLLMHVLIRCMHTINWLNSKYLGKYHIVKSEVQMHLDYGMEVSACLISQDTYCIGCWMNEMDFHQVLVFQLSLWPLLPWDVSNLPHVSRLVVSLWCAAYSNCGSLYCNCFCLWNCALREREEFHQDILTKWYICWIALLKKRLIVTY